MVLHNPFATGHSLARSDSPFSFSYRYTFGQHSVLQCASQEAIVAPFASSTDSQRQ